MIFLKKKKKLKTRHLNWREMNVINNYKDGITLLILYILTLILVIKSDNSISLSCVLLRTSISSY